MTAQTDRTISRILRSARAECRDLLLETEGLDVVRAMGVAVPARLVVAGHRDVAAADLSSIPGDRIVVKVVSADIPHKTEVGGVAVVPRDPSAVKACLERMEQRFTACRVAGYSLNQFVPHDGSPGGEVLLGMRWTEEFGPVVTVGPGGTYAEFLSAGTSRVRNVAVLSPEVSDTKRVEARLRSLADASLIGRGLEGEAGVVGRFLAFASRFVPDEIVEFEINPLVSTAEGPVALDALVRLGRPREPLPPERPLWKLEGLLQPRSAAVIGVSRNLNPGRTILVNMLRAGFDRDRLFVVKSGEDRVEGCRCYPDVASLPERVDLCVLSIGAAQVPATIREILRHRKAQSLIVIPGGLGERGGTEDRAREIRASLAAERDTEWQGPLVNGGNCLGIRSQPGRYDATFIPHHKFPPASGGESSLALISQSGAFAVARTSKLVGMEPRYLVSVGNQLDLTVGDYLSYLAHDPAVQVFACYVEGFRTLDGLKWLRAAEEIAAGGRTVLLYRGGRTAAGARATVTHTASVAGDYVVTRELAEQAGVVVADSLADFEDLTRLFCGLRGKRVRGPRLGAVSNAGFECVAMADNLGGFRLPRFTGTTEIRLRELLARCRLDGIVDVGNPLDTTPMMDDASFAEAVQAVLEDDEVDMGVVGCVPHTGALNTLARSRAHDEDVEGEGSVAGRLGGLAALPKPWVAVVDAGPLYDPMAAVLERAGIPTFRSADRAMRLFDVYCSSRLDRQPQEPDSMTAARETGVAAGRVP